MSHCIPKCPLFISVLISLLCYLIEGQSQLMLGSDYYPLTLQDCINLLDCACFPYFDGVTQTGYGSVCWKHTWWPSRLAVVATWNMSY